MGVVRIELAVEVSEHLMSLTGRDRAALIAATVQEQTELVRSCQMQHIHVRDDTTGKLATVISPTIKAELD